MPPSSYWSASRPSPPSAGWRYRPAGLALGVERVELHLEPFLARLARVDRAAELASAGFESGCLRHALPPMVLQAEEDPAVPARAGDGAGDGGERLVGAALPFVAVVQHRDGVLDALPFADQPRAGDRPVVGADPAQNDVAAVELLAERFEPLDRLRLQAAIGQFLNPVGEPAFQEAPIVGRRLGVEEFAPLASSGRASASSSAPPAAPEWCPSWSCVSPLRSELHDRSGRAGSEEQLSPRSSDTCLDCARFEPNQAACENLADFADAFCRGHQIRVKRV